MVHDACLVSNQERVGQKSEGRGQNLPSVLCLLPYTDFSLCPSFSFFVFKYRRVVSTTGVTSSGSDSATDKPYPSSPMNFRGLLVSRRIVRDRKSTRLNSSH